MGFDWIREGIGEGGLMVGKGLRGGFIGKVRENVFVVLRLGKKVVVKEIVVVYLLGLVVLSEEMKFFVGDFGFGDMEEGDELVVLVVGDLVGK
ncbi:hypothetical protein, partial [Neisseria sicca]|uniref:hypothetical protein n=1 Tax=Neisseria sicca TaxID=490 RepID=UPI0011BD1E81